MVGYKLSKNDWVTPFFVIFRSVREKLLVTVSFDHPVIIIHRIRFRVLRSMLQFEVSDTFGMYFVFVEKRRGWGSLIVVVNAKSVLIPSHLCR